MGLTCHGSGTVVSFLAFNFEDASSNLALS